MSYSPEESDKSTGKVSISTTELYRVGAPGPLPALPLKTESIASESIILQAFNSIRLNVRAILHRNQIDLTNMSFVKRFEPWNEATEKDCTVLVKGTYDVNIWAIAVSEIQDLLIKANIPQVGIEFLDPIAIQHFYLVKMDNYQAHVIIGVKGHLEHTEDAPFMFGGDSGSFVMDTVGDLSALAFTGDVDSVAGYCMPIGEIYDDIFQKTGARVIWPPRA